LHSLPLLDSVMARREKCCRRARFRANRDRSLAACVSVVANDHVQPAASTRRIRNPIPKPCGPTARLHTTPVMTSHLLRQKSPVRAWPVVLAQLLAFVITLGLTAQLPMASVGAASKSDMISVSIMPDTGDLDDNLDSHTHRGSYQAVLSETAGVVAPLTP
jgi:hypothetical protein